MIAPATWLVNKKAMGGLSSVYPWLNYPIYLILWHRVQWVDQWKVIIPKAAKALSTDNVPAHWKPSSPKNCWRYKHNTKSKSRTICQNYLSDGNMFLPRVSFIFPSVRREIGVSLVDLNGAGIGGKDEGKITVAFHKMDNCRLDVTLFEKHYGNLAVGFFFRTDL